MLLFGHLLKNKCLVWLFLAWHFIIENKYIKMWKKWEMITWPPPFSEYEERERYSISSMYNILFFFLQSFSLSDIIQIYKEISILAGFCLGDIVIIFIINDWFTYRFHVGKIKQISFAAMA